MKQEVWVRVDRNGKPVKVALTPRGVAGPEQYGHKVIRYVPESKPEPAPSGAQPRICSGPTAKTLSSKDKFAGAVSMMLLGWAAYAAATKASYGGNIGSDCVLGPEWAAIGRGIHGLLNGETGQLDCGAISSYIIKLFEQNNLSFEE